MNSKENTTSLDLKNEQYKKIINLKYDGIKSRQRMSREKRALQFASFRAVTDFDCQIEPCDEFE